MLSFTKREMETRVALTRSAVAISAEVLALIWSLEAIAEPIPRDLQGHWCAMRGVHLTVTATAATFGGYKPAEAGWIPKDGLNGRSEIRWRGEGIVSNLEYSDADETLQFSELGWGMGQPQVIYRRCAAPIAR